MPQLNFCLLTGEHENCSILLVNYSTEYIQNKREVNPIQILDFSPPKETFISYYMIVKKNCIGIILFYYLLTYLHIYFGLHVYSVLASTYVAT